MQLLLLAYKTFTSKSEKKIYIYIHTHTHTHTHFFFKQNYFAYSTQFPTPAPPQRNFPHCDTLPQAGSQPQSGSVPWSHNTETTHTSCPGQEHLITDANPLADDDTLTAVQYVTEQRHCRPAQLCTKATGRCSMRTAWSALDLHGWRSGARRGTALARQAHSYSG